MIYIILIILILGYFNVKKLLKYKMKKELIVWVAFALMTIAFTIYFYNVKGEVSLSIILMDLFNIDY